MNIARYAVLALILAGCSNHYAVLSTAVAPGQSPSRADPIYLVTPSHPSIAEQKAGLDIRSELCRNGFTLVDDPKRARWHLGYSVKTSTDAADRAPDYSIGRALLLGPFAAVQPGDAIARTMEILTLYRPGPDGVPVPIWEGAARLTEKEAAAYGPVAVKVLLDKFGRDFQGRARLSKAYLSDIQEAGQCIPGKTAANP